MRAPRLQDVSPVLALAALVALLVSGLECVQQGSVTAAGAWLRQHPLECALNVGVALGVGLFALGLVGRALPAALLTAALFGLMLLVHQTKMGLLGKPLLPWDVLLHREAFDLLPEVWQHAGRATLGCVALAVAGLAGLAARLRGPRLGARLRVGLLVTTAAVALTAVPGLRTRLAPWGVRHLRWAQADNTKRNGLLLGFALNLEAVAVSRPASYGPEAVRAALQGPRRSPTARAQRPTVIVVMSESFFDPTRLPGVRFPEDPVPTLHRLQAQAAAGTLYPPVFGGGTANTEFEFLTGHAMRFLPQGSVPYQQYVRRRHASLASIFAAQGYRTAAVHTHHRWFWERESVYRHFGFQRFTGLEDLAAPEKDGKYVSDAVLTREILREYEASPEPLFLFAVSMEAHGPYEPGRYAGSPLTVEGPLDEAARASLTTYAEAARHADRELGALVDYFSRVAAPVTLVFFGDHLPSLPEVFAQTGVLASPHALDSASLSTRAFLHQVPLVVWSNTGPPPRALGDLSTAFLGPLVLELTDTPGTAYSDFLGEVRRQRPVVIPGLVADADGNLGDELPEALERRWWLLEYDALFGDAVGDEPSTG